MGLKVTASQAAALVDRHERIVRWHLTRGDLPAVKEGNAWRIDTDDLARVPGWTINRDRLGELQGKEERTAAHLAARVEALERDLQLVRARLRVLEGANAYQTHTEGQEIGAPSEDGKPYGYSAPRPSVAPASASVSLTYDVPGASGRLASRADAGRWLARHGINSPYTPKTWPGWNSVSLEPSAVLSLALGLQDPANHRITWRLHRCDDPACVCHGMLPG